MKRPLVLLLVIALVVALWQRAPPAPAPSGANAPASTAPSTPTTPTPAAADTLAAAIAAQAQDVPVTGRGTVLKLLPDDREGSPHQRILVRVAGGGTVLIAHNLELAPRVAPLAVGDELEFAGEYVWNDKGGVVHWTHPDPRGRHAAGWIRRIGR